MFLANRTDRRLNVVIPPGLVAAATAGQGFQSMGLGLPTRFDGRFGPAGSTRSGDAGFRSVDLDAEGVASEPIGLEPGQELELTLPSVCLNFGLPTPTPSNRFEVMPVESYTSDARAQKALKSLAVLGTSQGVAQAVVWNVFNGTSFPQMAKEARRYLNTQEISVAARFIDALDASGTHDLVDPAYFREGRILVRIGGEGAMAEHAKRLRAEVQGTSVLGLPVQVVDDVDAETSRPSSLLIDVELAGATAPGDATRTRVQLRTHDVLGGWTRMGASDVVVDAPPSQLSAGTLGDALERAITASFVTATPGRRTAGATTFRVVNRLPFTVDALTLRTSREADGPTVTIDGLGVGPGRATMVTLPTAAGFVDRASLNGL
jgi:hypothetical protein